MRKYFYVDSAGQLKKYFHCSRGCEEPYKKEEIGNKIYKVSDNTFLCKRCIQELNLSVKMNVSSIDETLEETNSLEEKNEFNVLDDFKSSVKDSPFYSIVIQCNDQTYYFGITSDVEKAIKSHNRGSGSSYTKERRPVKLIDFKAASSFDEAKQIKEEFCSKYKNV